MLFNREYLPGSKPQTFRNRDCSLKTYFLFWCYTDFVTAPPCCLKRRGTIFLTVTIFILIVHLDVIKDNGQYR